MNAKQKAASLKENWQAMRVRYTWHLRPPFNDEFDHSHWWEGESQIDPVAALYELARRHPMVGQLRFQLRRASWYGQELRAPLVGAAKEKMASQAFDDLGQEPEAIHCLCLIGLKSWPKLGWSYQEYWGMSAGKMKGLDCRHDVGRCTSINLMAQGDIFMKRARSLKLGRGALQFWVQTGRNNSSVAPVHPQAYEKGSSLLMEHLHQNPISSAEWEAAIAQGAVAAHRKGHLLFSVAPDLTADEAKILLDREYRAHLKRTRAVKQRARWENWLPLIAAFENDEAQHGGTKSQAFTRYRRTMDGIQFAPGLDTIVTTTPSK